MRGAPHVSLRRDHEPWIIPADAGSTSSALSFGLLSTDHPRGCGEHRFIEMTLFERGGSSPRMRGAPDGCCIIVVARGIIPADAGSTDCIRGRRRLAEDHPRGCGEHRVIACLSSASWGSSPRMRGALLPRQARRPSSRIIPADAGSTGA